MFRKCERCNYEISSSYILAQDEYKEIMCPNCGRKLVVTKMSRVLTGVIAIMISSIIILFPLKLLIILLIECIWLIVADLILPAFIYEYKEKK